MMIRRGRRIKGSITCFGKMCSGRMEAAASSLPCLSRSGGEIKFSHSNEVLWRLVLGKVSPSMVHTVPRVSIYPLAVQQASRIRKLRILKGEIECNKPTPEKEALYEHIVLQLVIVQGK